MYIAGRAHCDWRDHGVEDEQESTEQQADAQRDTAHEQALAHKHPQVCCNASFMDGSCMHARTHACTCVCVCVCVRTYVCMHMRTHMCVRMCMCMYVYVCVT